MVGYHICFHVCKYTELVPRNRMGIINYIARWATATLPLTWNPGWFSFQDPERWHMKKSHYDWVVFHHPLKKNNQPWGFVVHERFFFLSFAVSMPDRCSPSCLLHRKMRRGDWLWMVKKDGQQNVCEIFFLLPWGIWGYWSGSGTFCSRTTWMNSFDSKDDHRPGDSADFWGELPPPQKTLNEWLPKMMGWKNAAPFTNGNIWYSC